MKTHILVPLIAALSVIPASASILMLDFGPTGVSGASLTNSPYHTVAGTGFTDGTWNQVERTDVSSLTYSNGTVATGVAVNIGVAPGTVTPTVVNYATQPGSSSALGTLWPTAGGIYASPSVGRDGIFGVSGQSLGIQVTGLAAGIYEIFVVGRNTNTSNTIANSYVATGVVGENFDFAGLTPVSITYTSLTNTAAWIEGVNYSKHTITLAAGQALNIATQGTDNDSQFRGFMNSIQIVQQVPEPSVAVLSGALLVPLLRRRRA
ncbi:MAG: PEP-CTERM sorting domain-containing protein [Verrucomicrobiaceae bacterium]|nr:MAG: PEP-CTERM sorting domain-containing protein [Verrucomicrobiaceae bacterium]